MFQIGYTDEDPKVYKTKKVISEIKNSELNEDIKDELLEIIIDYGDEFCL